MKEWEKLPMYEKTEQEKKEAKLMRQAGRIGGEAGRWCIGLFSLAILGWVMLMYY